MKRILLLFVVLFALVSGQVVSSPKSVQANTNQPSSPHLLQSRLYDFNNATQLLHPTIFQVQDESIGKRLVPTPTTSASLSSSTDWGVAHQIDAHTWTVNLANDDRMATASEIFDALNTYRQKNGKAILIMDSGLARYAQSRADMFQAENQTDKHTGFLDFINNKKGFEQLGFDGLGENSSFGYKLQGVHIIEWMYAADSDHNGNQLNSEWTHVGIGVNGLATDLVFGGRKRN